MSNGREYDAEEIGVLRLGMEPRDVLSAGDVGYVIGSVKDVRDTKVGDTITHARRPASEPIAGFQAAKPMVFSGIYPTNSDDFEDLRASLDRLQLNDASLKYEPETSMALGFGFRIGFLGLLHMEIVQERLDREFGLDIITTVPNVKYEVLGTNGEIIVVENPSKLPSTGIIAEMREPYIKAEIITPTEYIGALMNLCQERRGLYINTQYLDTERVALQYELPLGETVFDFYDRLKTLSRGYASFDYEIIDYRPSKLVKLDVLINGEPVDALSTIVHTDKAYDMGRKLVRKLRELIPRQMFEVALQAAVGSRIIARETVKAMRKDVTAKCYGGDISRKRKLLEKQKEGKKRMKQVGSVEIPQEAFLCGVALLPAGVSHGQDLIDMYRTDRVRALSSSVENMRMKARAPEILGRLAGELQHWPKGDPAPLEEPEPPIHIARYQKVPKLGRPWFQSKFTDLSWSYEGSYRISPLDTMQTRELRARLQAQFGSPTQTLPDQGLLRKLDLPEYVQFEYWFFLNDSIPLVVMDVNGPFERGIVVASDEKYQSILSEVRDAFLSRLLDDPAKQSYADYYFEEELKVWYVTGYDGRDFFLRPVDPRRVLPGRPISPSG
jgi:hypothetical protein